MKQSSLKFCSLLMVIPFALTACGSPETGSNASVTTPATEKKVSTANVSKKLDEGGAKVDQEQNRKAAEAIFRDKVVGKTWYGGKPGEDKGLMEVEFASDGTFRVHVVFASPDITGKWSVSVGSPDQSKILTFTASSDRDKVESFAGTYSTDTNVLRLTRRENGQDKSLSTYTDTKMGTTNPD